MNKTIFTYPIIVVVGAILFASGCGHETKEVALLDTDRELEILAGLAEGVGSAQNTVEIIPVPQAQELIPTPMPIQADTPVVIQNNESPLATTTLDESISQPATSAVSSSSKVDSSSLDYSGRVQLALKNAGFYKGEIDGKVGAQTREAIKAFQASKGLKADGIAGEQTYNALKEFLD